MDEGRWRRRQRGKEGIIGHARWEDTGKSITMRDAIKGKETEMEKEKTLIS